MSSIKRLWWILGVMFFVSFTILGLIGAEIYQQAPPMPAKVETTTGKVIFTQQQMQVGRVVWQHMGGHQVGSIWGHGAYVAPDWSADWLHRELVALLNIWSQQEFAMPFKLLDIERQAMLKARLKKRIRTNTYDQQSNVIRISPERAEAIRQVASHYVSLFGDDAQLTPLREQYAIPNGAVPDKQHRESMAAFFFWTSWSAATQRPDKTITYTNNWPHEPLIGNAPSADNVLWTFISIILLIGSIGALVWYRTSRHEKEDGLPQPPSQNPFLGVTPTPSMRATKKYFFTVIALFVTQMTLGAITAHYAVEGHEFYGLALSEILPYSIVRTWHLQLSIFWIATAWLATGLYISPLISGHEPRFQKLGVDLLFVSLLVIVVGSMLGEWLAVQNHIGLDFNFWFGHQGYEFIDLGRFWQIFLFLGLMIWLVLMGRALWPALRKPSENQTLLLVLFLSTIAIGGFYGAGFNWGENTHLTMVEYWRWWVIHLWVEGFFEVFATTVIALLFAYLGLIRFKTATEAVLLSTLIFLTGGILGTLHHLYFSGTTSAVIAVGAVFSALEVAPLALIGYEAYERYKVPQRADWMKTYQWPIYFFVAVAFWNLVGAGMLGFLINPPLALYYIQGLNTTPTHAHASLFGVYGMLGIGLMLFCLRGLVPEKSWDDRLLKLSFWLLNIGLAAMVFISLLPAGLYQAWHSITTGFWYARSAEIIHSETMETLVWLRVPGDMIFAGGVVLLALFAIKLALQKNKN